MSLLLQYTAYQEMTKRTQSAFIHSWYEEFKCKSFILGRYITIMGVNLCSREPELSLFYTYAGLATEPAETARVRVTAR